MVRTPFMIGMSDAGSVDIDASSRKTTGKSMTRSAADADVIHVVHTYTRNKNDVRSHASRWVERMTVGGRTTSA